MIYKIIMLKNAQKWSKTQSKASRDRFLKELTKQHIYTNPHMAGESVIGYPGYRRLRIWRPWRVIFHIQNPDLVFIDLISERGGIYQLVKALPRLT